ncbi:prepilin peptidase [Ilumatobacter nonamiensis]|uniref:prepilin peptidase n=1 Tax=Ilumatobacter nonamiensis TaxID=467093 RepID=UPI0006879BDA|nr:A24 family peptidase [Ilumatobacter nonamiensis]
MSLYVLIPLVVAAGAVIGRYLAVVVQRAAEDGVPPGSAPFGSGPVEIAIANVAVWVVFAVRFHDVLFAALPAYLFFGSVLVTQSAIDIRIQRLPRQNTFVGITLGGTSLIVAALVVDEPRRIWMAGLGALIALALIGGVYAISNVVYGDDVAFGFGDVLLSPLLGLYLGWLNPGIVAPGLFFGFILGSIAAGIAILRRRGDTAGQLPFGPFLALGAVAAVFVGQPFLDLMGSL